MAEAMRFYRNPIFWLGVIIVMLALMYAWVGDPVAPAMQFSMLTAPPLGSDGRCTGFPNGIGRWTWAHCCVEHDLGGTDVALVACLTAAVPEWAWPLCFLGVALMGFARPTYNVLQRWGWVK